MIQMNSTKTSESKTVTQSVGQVVHDIVALAELQVQLFKSDALETGQRFMQPMAVFTLGILLLLATIPVCLIAVALGLVAVGLTPVAAFALVAIISIVAAGALTAWAWLRFHAMPAAFARSQEELARNITWIKDAVMDLTAKPQHSPDDLRNTSL